MLKHLQVMHTDESKNPIKPKWLRFLSEDIWEIEAGSFSRLRRYGLHLIRIILLVWKGFRENELPLHASALTYRTLVALVPILALATAILRGLGAGEVMEHKILQAIANMPQQFQDFIGKILDTVHNVNYTTLGGIGLIVLLLIVVQVMSRVERSFNRVWGVSASRTIIRKLADYLSILVVVPLLILAATTINATLSSTGIANFITSRLGAAEFLYPRLLALSPLLVTWVAFIFLYKYMPNTRVRITPAVISGVIGGSLWIGWQWIYMAFQVGVSRYNAIYATFASLLLFLFWLYISWQIVLLGAEIGFAVQNHSTYQLEQQAHDASVQAKITLALSVVVNAAEPMLNDIPQFDISDYAHKYQVPIRLVREVVNDLVKANLLAEVSESSGTYVLKKVPDMVQVNDVIQVILQSGSSPHNMGLDRLHPAIQQVLATADSGAASALNNLTVKDFLERQSQFS